MNREIIPSVSINAQIRLPGSKYIANRLIPLCALAKSQSVLTNVVSNNDIETAITGLSQLGYLFSQDKERLVISPRQAALDHSSELYTSHSGTFSRFVTAIAALESLPVVINCSEKMATRPMQELFDSLKQLSVSLKSDNQCLPAVINGPYQGDFCFLDASRSSQYLSGLLMIAPLLENGLKIQLTGELVSRAYVDMTIKLMAKLGVEVIENERLFSVKANQWYSGINYEIPCDPVSATYFMGAAAISGGKVTIKGFDFDSVQGESRFYQVLTLMGVKVEKNELDNDLTVIGTDQLKAIEVDMGVMPDAVQTLAVIACFAKGTTKITNIANLAYKESNRIEDTATELRKAGINVDTGIDYLIIHGGKPKAAEISTHQDHRMAMSMALLGIKTVGIKIIEAEVVEKSFPDYWEKLSQIGVSSQLL